MLGRWSDVRWLLAAIAFALELIVDDRVAAASTLTVQRSSAALDCPDATALARSIRAMTSKAPTPIAGDEENADAVRVTFDRGPEGYRVRIRTSGERAGSRELTDPTTSCSSLAQATALTVALILDPEASLPPPSAPPPADTAEPTAAAPPSGRWRIAVEAGGGVAAGIVRPVAPLGYVEASVFPRPIFSVSIGGVVVPTQSLPLERGAVEVGLAAARLSACFFPVTAPIRVGVCGGAIAGVLSASGRGYPAEDTARRPLLGLSAELVGGGPIVGPLGWSARIGGIAVTHRESFGITGAGVAYEMPPVGGVVTLGVTMTFR